jgi:hypothetical protein
MISPRTPFRIFTGTQLAVLVAALCLHSFSALAAPTPAPATPRPPLGSQPAPLRVLFKGYAGDPSMPDKIAFELVTVDAKQPNPSLKLGELIPNTKWKLQSFNYVIKKDADASELTVINTDTKEQKVLTLSLTTDLPTRPAR